MASKSLDLPTMLLFLVTFLYTFIDCNSTKPSTSSSTSCPSFDCGNGLTMGYPFWLKSNKPYQYCGYQGFGISCNGDVPILSLSNHIYNVKNFNKSEKTFTITYTNITDPKCPVAPHDVVLNNSSSSMNYTYDDTMILFFYNCSLYPPSLQDIKCLQYGAVKHSFVFADGAIPEFDWENYCEAIMKVPVIESNSGDIRGDLVVNSFNRALSEGFKLRWKSDLVCQSCEATGGFCGQRNIGISPKFVCFCGDGQHPFHCHDDSGTISMSNETNYTAIGAFTFGGLMIIISTILYHIRNRNIGTKKQGFSQIPSNGR